MYFSTKIKVMRNILNNLLNKNIITITRSTINILGLEIYFYGLCYVAAFFLCRYMICRMLNYRSEKSINEIDRIIFTSFLFGILGGRVGCILIYGNHSSILAKLVYSIFSRWHGMDFRSGLLVSGLSMTYMLYNSKNVDLKQDISVILSAVAQYVPLGISIGRFGNFLNEEFMQQVKLGSITLPLCLFSMITEGLLGFLIISIINKYENLRYGYLYFLMIYNCFRFINDFYRPDDAGPIIYMMLRSSQFVCVLIFLLSFLILIYRKKSIRHRKK